MILKIHGAPGTGKTYRTIQLFKESIRNGVPINNIMYTTYRKEATSDALTQISKEIGLPVGKSKKTVKTVHGMCLSLLYEKGVIGSGNLSNQIFNEMSDIPVFNKEFNYSIKPSRSVQEAVFTGRMDPYLSAYTFMRSTRTPLKEAHTIPFTKGLTFAEFKQFAKDFEEWKENHNKIGYDDMIDMTIKEGLCPDCVVQIYDEAQDMTTQIRDVSCMWSREADTVILAGDPLQTLYPFWGADPGYFMNWPGDIEVLPVSRRLPAKVWGVAADLIANRTPYKVPDIQTRSEAGIVSKIDNSQLKMLIDLHPEIYYSSVFHLVRTSYAGLGVAEILAEAGIPFGGMEQYAWTNKERNLYNAIKSIQNFKTLSPSEFCAVVDSYPTFLTGAPTSIVEREEFKKLIKNGQKPPTLEYFDQSLIETIKSNEPLAQSFIKSKLTVLKLKGAYARGVQKITEADLQNIQLLTIHGAKGLEADTVFLHNGITRAIQTSLYSSKGIENEAYVWYVGITRAKKRLIFVTQQMNGYSIPGVCS